MAKSGTETISLAELRARLVGAQGYASRARTGTAPELLATIRRLACVQLDSISTVDRSHRLALGARVGAYPEHALARLMRAGRIFEYWAHEACLVPVEDFRLHRWRMQQFAESHPWRGNVFEREPELTERVLAEIAERGPLGSRHFEGNGSGGMWNWKPAKIVLEALHSAGRLVIAGRESFQRLYDLPERVLPADALAGEPPTRDEFVRWATLRGVEARGALTEKAVAEMWRLKGGVAGIRPHADALIEAGRLRRVAVADGGPPVLVPAQEDGRGTLPAAVLLPPFDNLLWDRAFLERAFGFRHVIEVYKREHERVYGYYVLPLLRRERIVGRVDLKHDRAERTLRVKAFHPEPGVRGDLRATLHTALQRLARVVGAEAIDSA
ncbi:MAG TPA: crosslink repair DNA glycosylase YcaQ family protein [Gaiellaceae bacterium]|nr:crosslink repair DNA glycosylase YcaQ family protein [Gaiellaceae bacterium]